MFRTIRTMGLGALLAYFFDPDNGRRRRAMARDRVPAFFRSMGGSVGVSALGAVLSHQVAEKVSAGLSAIGITANGHQSHSIPDLSTLPAPVRAIFERYGTPADRARCHQISSMALLRRDRYRVSPEILEHVRAYRQAVDEAGDAAALPAARFQLGHAALWADDLVVAAAEIGAARMRTAGVTARSSIRTSASPNVNSFSATFQAGAAAALLSAA